MSAGATNRLRPGDVDSPLGRMRLTVEGLFEIARSLQAESPQDLAKIVRTLTTDEARHLLAALLRPCRKAGDGNDPDRDPDLWAAQFTPQDIAAAMPFAARCVAEAFS